MAGQLCIKVIYGGSAGPGLLPRIDAGVDGMFLGRFARDPSAVRTTSTRSPRCREHFHPTVRGRRDDGG